MSEFYDEILQNAVLSVEPPSKNGKRLKMNYVTQGDVAPPTFIFFVNDRDLCHFTYERYLENCLRKAVDFSGTPIKLIFKNKGDKNE